MSSVTANKMQLDPRRCKMLCLGRGATTCYAKVWSRYLDKFLTLFEEEQIILLARLDQPT